MEEITSIAKKIVNAFPDAQCTTEDAFDADTNSEVEDNVVVGDDYLRREWMCEYEVTSGTHDSITRKMIETFGEPSARRHRSDLGEVNNWDIGKVLIVQAQNTITLIQKYTKW